MKIGIRGKLIIIFTAVFTAAFVLIGAVFYFQFSTFALDLAKQKLQSDTNSITDSTVLQVLADEVIDMNDSGEADSEIRQFYIDLFHDIQADYPELDLELGIAVVNEDEQSFVNLLYMTADGEVDPIETIPVDDAESWQTWVESTDTPFQFDIAEDETGIWTNSSAPILTTDFEPSGAVLDVLVRADDQLSAVRERVRNTMLIGAVIGYPLLLLAIFLISTTATRSLNQIISASQMLERGEMYGSSLLERTAKRSDELGQLARTFDKMAIEVQGREETLKQRVVQLQIEIDYERQQKHVSEIVETDYFQELKDKSARLREGKKPSDDAPSVPHEEKPMNTSEYMANLQEKAKKMREKKPDSADPGNTETGEQSTNDSE